MREIKFRAWTGTTMEYSVMAGTFGAFYVNAGIHKDGLDPNDKACLTPFNTLYSKEVPVMQFTGLKDKNGKEIYEGDILKVYFTGKSPRVIEWKNGEHNIGFNIGSSQQQLFEVIGNIYENPELLNS